MNHVISSLAVLSAVVITWTLSKNLESRTFSTW